jgi:hypothetical protein
MWEKRTTESPLPKERKKNEVINFTKLCTLKLNFSPFPLFSYLQEVRFCSLTVITFWSKLQALVKIMKFANVMFWSPNVQKRSWCLLRRLIFESSMHVKLSTIAAVIPQIIDMNLQEFTSIICGMMFCTSWNMGRSMVVIPRVDPFINFTSTLFFSVG